MSTKNEYVFSREELVHIVSTFKGVIDELESAEGQTDWVFTTGVREEIDESLIIIEAAINHIDTVEVQPEWEEELDGDDAQA